MCHVSIVFGAGIEPTGRRENLYNGGNTMDLLRILKKKTPQPVPMTDYEEKIWQAYPEKIAKIAEHLFQDEGMRICFNHPSVDEIVAKLNEPSLRVFDDSGVLTFCNHEFDNIHVIDLEFSGVLEKFSYVSIDG
jgi:hypothetical protein